MQKKTYRLAVEQTGDEFQATVSDLHVAVTGASLDEVVLKSVQAIDRALAANLRAPRIRRRTHKQTVA